MLRVICCILIGAAMLSAQVAPQAADNLNSAIRNAGAGDSGSQRLADSILAFSGDPQRGRREAAAFTEEFTRAVNGRTFSREQATALRTCMVDMLRGGGVSNFSAARQLRDLLAAMRVEDLRADAVIRRFIALGEAVRGPDDAPVREKIAPGSK